MIACKKTSRAENRLEVGDHAVSRHPAFNWRGIVVEDRGDIATNGSQIVAIRRNFDPEASQFEPRIEELERVDSTSRCSPTCFARRRASGRSCDRDRCDHSGAHMKVVTVRAFRDHASEMFRSDDVVLVTRDGAPAGFFLPWDTPELPVEVRREVFLRLSEQIGTALKATDVDEQEVLDDFAASRGRR